MALSSSRKGPPLLYFDYSFKVMNNSVNLIFFSYARSKRLERVLYFHSPLLLAYGEGINSGLKLCQACSKALYIFLCYVSHRNTTTNMNFIPLLRARCNISLELDSSQTDYKCPSHVVVQALLFYNDCCCAFAILYT
jgi:hypothetical protein